MASSGNITLFTSGGSGSGGGSSGEYVQDVFEDVSLAATNNTGFSSTVSTNPFSKYFGNDDAPKYSVKTLWVKDLVLLEDRTKWVTNLPTYEVIFNENFPGVFAYVCGNIRLRNSTQGISVDLRGIDDIFGITGVIRRAGWILNATTQTCTADILLDGVDTTRDVTSGSAVLGTNSQGINAYNVQMHSTTNETKDIHDYRITANNDFSLNVAGIVIYYENAGADIDLFPGSTYVNKEKETSTSLTTAALPTISGRLGGNTIVYKNSVSGYSLTTQEPSTISSVGIGSSGTNLIGVVTGFGGSFPIGSGVVAITAGSSFYVGTVSNQSTDTLTVGPTLGFGLSGTIYKAWAAGITIAISASLYKLAYSFDPGIGNVLADTNGFGTSANGDFYYSDSLGRYRIWGDQLAWVFQDGTDGVAFNGATVGFLQVDGRFAALEFELAKTPGVTGILHATLGFNGVASVANANIFIAENQKITAITSEGLQWNSLVLNVGASFGNLAISRINFYELNNIGVSLGMLASFDELTDRATRAATNASLVDIGLHQRNYADQLYLTTDWTRGTTTTSAGGVHYAGTTGIMKFQYYGTDFGLVGSAGTSCGLVFDGASLSSTFNVMKTVATLGFHTVVLTGNTGTTRIEAVDTVRPKDEIKNLQNYLSTPEQDDSPKFYEQSQTPRAPKSGDFWAQTVTPNILWQYFFGRWNQVNVTGYSDDPNVGTVYKAGGTTTGASAGATSVAETFNLAAWSTIPSLPGNLSKAGGANAAFNGGMHLTDGASASAVTSANYRFNRASWSSLATKATAVGGSSNLTFNSILYCSMGTTDPFGQEGTNMGLSAVTTLNKWSGTAWSTGTAYGSARASLGGAVTSSLLSSVGGFTTGGAQSNDHQQKNTSDANSSATVLPQIGCPYGSGNYGVVNSSFVTNQAIDTNSTTATYTWNGTVWSALLATAYGARGDSYSSAYNSIQGINIGVAGQTTGTSGAITTCQKYNGVAFSLTTSCGTATGNCTSASL